MRIAICDDEKVYRDQIYSYVKTYMKKVGVECFVDVYESGEALLENVEGLAQYSVIFLDVNMSKISGVETAQKIREYSEDVFIVFITAYIDYYLEGYKVEAIRYLLKNAEKLKDAIDECMNAIMEKMHYTLVVKKYKFNECEKEIVLNKVIYVESNLHKLIFYVMDNGVRLYTMYGKLDDIEKDFKENSFIRVHQSFLVNMRHIKLMNKNILKMSDGNEIIIPKARFKEVKSFYMDYLGKM